VRKEKVVAINRKARYDYHIIETFEAGIVLKGTEVKSLRAGQADLKDSYARGEDKELFLYNMHISPFEKGNRFNQDPKRTRKLLMHRREILRLLSRAREKGLALIPVRIYFNERGRAKVELALARGKRSYDKRKDIAERDAQREMERITRSRY
jgi:SsrA-binding protein